MADISPEISAFQNAVYGEEVRGSMVSLANKLNDVTEDCESTVASFEDGIADAITDATTAAANANSKATLANTAASDANTAKTAANNAATAANNAASSATAAANTVTATNTSITNAETARVTAENGRATAEAGRVAAENGRVTAENARVAAESARASAESARESAEGVRQSNETTRQGNETVRQNNEQQRVIAEGNRVSEFSDMEAAFADMQRTIIPQATTTVMGGVIVGDGLSVDNALLSLDMAKGGTGTSVQAGGSSLAGATVYGEAIQDDTPTPSTPVPIEVVEGRNLLTTPLKGYITGSVGSFAKFNADASGGTVFVCKIQPNTTYTMRAEPFTGANRKRLVLLDTDPSDGSKVAAEHCEWLTNNDSFDSTWTQTFNSGSWTWVMIGLSTNATAYTPDAIIQLEVGSMATPFVPNGCIGLKVGSSVTPIDLDENVLASLPDGTKDIIEINNVGQCTLTKRVGFVNLGNLTWNSLAGNRFSASIADAQNPPNNSRIANAICSYYPTVSTTDTGNETTGFSISYQRNAVIYDSEHISDTAEQFGAAMSDVEVYYQLATPEIIELGYIDLPTIPSDGAAVSVVATITPVIDAGWWEHGAEEVPQAIGSLYGRVVSEAVNQLALSTLASVEGAKASANYAVGSYLVMDGTLYRVTAAIATGEAIVPGTNVTATTVMAEIVTLTS